MHISADSSRRIAWLAVPLAVVASGVIVGTSSYAAFSATTDNAANAWRTGTVALSDDDSDQALFDVDDLVPGESGDACITVTTSTSKPSTVKLYTSASSDDNLAQYLDLTVERGTLGTPGDCATFASTDSVSAGTLADLQQVTDYRNGLGAWDPATGDESATYKFTYTLQDSTPNTAQDSSAGTTFVWEAQSK